MTGSALSVVAGKNDILGFEVEKGRIAYIILENPTDFRMKLSVSCYFHNITVKDFNTGFTVEDARMPHEQMMAKLKADADRYGPFQLICYDTFQAGFAGAQFNDNNDTLKHAQNLRELTTLPGSPSVLVACHPVKNATREGLEPYGGGSTMNEFDGNLTLWSDAGTIELNHNKVRGPEFEPRYFRIETLGSPDILDNKGRQPQLPVMRPISEQAVEERKNADDDFGRALLRQMLDAPNGSQRQWGDAVRRSKSRVNDKLHNLAKEGLVTNALGSWNVTSKGAKALQNAAERSAA
jgi:hypothetical protein